MAAPVISTAPEKATRVAYGETLLALGKESIDVVVLDADLSSSTQTHLFAKAFPDRFFQMGIAEMDMVNTAAGLSLMGKIPFCSSFAMFASGKAWEPIRNTIAYSNLKVKIGATHAGVTVGEDGASHQALEDLALMRVIPNMTVLCPSDAIETEQLVRQAVDHDGPVYIRLGRMPVPIINSPEEKSFIGKMRVLEEGDDVTLVAIGSMVSEALKASRLLGKRGIQASVLNVHTLKPLDTSVLEEFAKRTGALVTAEEHSIHGGLYGAVSEHLSATYPVPIIPIGVQGTFGQSGKPKELLEYYGLTADKIAEAAGKAMDLKQKMLFPEKHDLSLQGL